MEKPQSLLPWDKEGRGPWVVQPISQASSPYVNQNQSGNRVSDGLKIWYSIKTTWDDKGLEAPVFSLLSVAELNSFRILLEWWDGKTQKSSPSKRAQEQLEDFSHSPDITTGQHPPFLIYDIKDALGTSIEPNENTKSAKEVRSNYNEQLFMLFQQEFCGLDSGETPKAFWLQLYTQRQTCAELASCQRMAHSLCCSVISENLVGGEGHTSLNSDKIRKQLSNHISASIHPCPWLTPKKRHETQLPRYLWDVSSMRTVDVNTLAVTPQYVTISHTWGRWREDSKPPIRVPGADWDIPQNTRFHVEKLPYDLKKLPLPCPYVWLDLFCIPQDNRKEAQEEIARQAAIFTGAASSIVWLNEIESWERTENEIQWYAYQYLQLANPETCVLEETVINDRIEKAAKASDQKTQLWDEAEKRALGWFTSLWTLQEACLRPDMWICNKSWELLTLNCSVPVSFDTTIAISQTVMGFYHSQELMKNAPLGPRVFFGVLHLTGMSSLLHMSQQEVLILGDKRECTGRRAEAIMSVLGTTDWYINQLHRTGISPQEDGLVLGKYPLSFVEEVKDKVGALFFCASSPESILKEMENKELGSRPEAWGTLLPFRPGLEGRPKNSPLQDGLFTDEHPTVKCWKVESDGSVTISTAAIIASTNDDTKDFRAAIYGPDVQHYLQENASFRQFFKSVKPNLPKYAIQIAKGQQGNIRGIILMQVFPDRDYFVKISDFGIESKNYGGSTPNVIQCQWHVL